ncbi:MAG: hypothetical protein ACI83O_000756 [Patescibacteria group bacterium]|jgi:hypothetical protein
MADVISIAPTVGYFLPIFSFLLVMIVSFAILQKSKILGDNTSVSLMLSFLFALFFIVDVQLVDFVNFTSAWVAVIVVFMFFLFLTLAFIPGDDNLKFLAKGNWFSIVVLIGMLIFFTISSSFIFNWAINWDWIASGGDSEWFGFILLLIIGGVVRYVLGKR